MSVLINLTGTDNDETVWLWQIASMPTGTYTVTASSADVGATYAFVAYTFPAGTYSVSTSSSEEDSNHSLSLNLPTGADYYIYEGANGNSSITTTISHIDADGRSGYGGAVVGHDSLHLRGISGSPDLVMGGIAVTRTDSGFVAPTIQSQVYRNSLLFSENFTFTANAGDMVILAVTLGYYSASSITLPPKFVAVVDSATATDSISISILGHTITVTDFATAVDFILTNAPFIMDSATATDFIIVGFLKIVKDKAYAQDFISVARFTDD